MLNDYTKENRTTHETIKYKYKETDRFQFYWSKKFSLNFFHSPTYFCDKFLFDLLKLCFLCLLTLISPLGIVCSAFLVVHTGIRQPVVSAPFYTFSIDSTLTEFAAQHIGNRSEAARLCVLGQVTRFVGVFLPTLPTLPSCLNCFPCIRDPSGKRSPDRCSSFSQNHNFSQRTVNSMIFQV